MKRISFLLIMASIFILLAGFVSAGNVKHTLKGLVEYTPLIVTGKVLQISTAIETEKGREVVYTCVTIGIEYILKGELNNSSLVVKMLGGNAGNKGGWSEEWFPFKSDEEVLLFLHSKDKANNIWQIKSISGKLSITNINGIKYYGCSMLRADEVSKYDSNPYFEKRTIINRINDYMLEKKGGK